MTTMPTPTPTPTPPPTDLTEAIKDLYDKIEQLAGITEKAITRHNERLRQLENHVATLAGLHA